MVAVTFCYLCMFSLSSRVLFLVFFFFGCVAIFAANPSWTLVILSTAPQSIRSLAIGIATIFYHMLGDVPAPIIIGKMIDVFIARVETERQIIVYRGVLQGLMSLSILLVGLGLDCEE